MDIHSNYCRVTFEPNWRIYQYDVRFNPDYLSTDAKTELLKKLPETGNESGAFVYEGRTMFTVERLQQVP